MNYFAGFTRQRNDRCGREPLMGSARSEPMRRLGLAERSL
jgi:hypothetical protein